MRDGEISTELESKKRENGNMTKILQGNVI